MGETVNYPEKDFNLGDAEFGSSAKSLLVALVKESHQWVRDLNRWSNGSVIHFEFMVLLSMQELDIICQNHKGPVTVLVDSSNTNAVEHLNISGPCKDRRTIVIQSSKGSAKHFFAGIDTITYPFTPEEISETLAWRSPPALTITETHPPRESAVLESIPQYIETEYNPTAKAKVIGVLGVGGAGSSTLAMSIAQVLAETSKVILVDFCSDADLSMYHDIDRSLPSLTELLTAARQSSITVRQLRTFCIPVIGRNYFLLPGAKRQDETLLWRNRALEDVLSILQTEFEYVVCDLDGSFRSSQVIQAASAEATTLASEVALVHADAVVITMSNDLRGIHGGLRIFHRLVGDGRALASLALCVNRVPHKFTGKRQFSNANLTKLVNEVATKLFEEPALTNLGRNKHQQRDQEGKPTIFSAREERSLEQIHESVRPLPNTIGSTLAEWIENQYTDRDLRQTHTQVLPRRILPGELGVDILSSERFYG